MNDQIAEPSGEMTTEPARCPGQHLCLVNGERKMMQCDEFVDHPGHHWSREAGLRWHNHRRGAYTQVDEAASLPEHEPNPFDYDPEETTMTEEPVEDRIARAYANGFRDGLDRGIRGHFDHS